MNELKQPLKKSNINRTVEKSVPSVSGVLGNQAMIRNHEMSTLSIQRKLPNTDGVEDETLPKDSVLYHGSSALRTAFNEGIKIELTRQKQLGDGFYTSVNKKIAQGYGNVFILTALRDLNGQKIPACKEMKSITEKTPAEILFFNRADEGNDFLHTTESMIDATTIFEQHKLTKDGVKSDAVRIVPEDSSSLPASSSVPSEIDETERSFSISMGKPNATMPKALRRLLKTPKEP